MLVGLLLQYFHRSSASHQKSAFETEKPLQPEPPPHPPPFLLPGTRLPESELLPHPDRLCPDLFLSVMGYQLLCNYPNLPNYDWRGLGWGGGAGGSLLQIRIWSQEAPPSPEPGPGSLSASHFYYFGRHSKVNLSLMEQLPFFFTLRGCQKEKTSSCREVCHDQL